MDWRLNIVEGGPNIHMMAAAEGGALVIRPISPQSSGTYMYVSCRYTLPYTIQ